MKFPGLHRIGRYCYRPSFHKILCTPTCVTGLPTFQYFVFIEFVLLSGFCSTHQSAYTLPEVILRPVNLNYVSTFHSVENYLFENGNRNLFCKLFGMFLPNILHALCYYTIADEKCTYAEELMSFISTCRA